MWGNQWGSEWGHALPLSLLDKLEHWWNFDELANGAITSGSTVEDKIGGWDLTTNGGYYARTGTGTFRETSVENNSTAMGISRTLSSADFSRFTLAFWSAATHTLTSNREIEIVRFDSAGDYKLSVVQPGPFTHRLEASWNASAIDHEGWSNGKYWSLVVLRYDGTTLKLNSEGRSSSPPHASNFFTTATSTLSTSDIPTGDEIAFLTPVDPLGGVRIDEIMFFSDVLTDTELETLWRAGLGSFAPGFGADTNIDSATLILTPHALHEPIDSATLILTPDDIEPGPVITSLDSAALEITPDGIEAGAVETSVSTATLELTPQDIVLPVTTSIDSASLILTPDTVTLALESASLILTPQALVEPIVVPIDSATLEITPDEIEPGPVITSLDSAALTITPDSIEAGTVVTSVSTATLILTPDDIEAGTVVTSIDTATITVTVVDVEPGPMVTNLSTAGLLIVPSIIHGRYFNKVRLISLAQKSATIQNIARN